MKNLEKFHFDDGKETGHKKILMSNVVVTRNRKLFRGRKWHILDVITVLWIVVVHLLTLFALFAFTWGAFWAGIWCYTLTGLLGVTLSYHRNLAHRSFNLPKWLEYTFAYFGVQAAQRDPIFWVSIHRSHHQYVDSEKDPHSPTYGFWFSHMGWLFDSGYIVEKYKERKNVEDLKSQAFYRFIKRTYLWHVLGFAVIVYALGGFPYLVWVMGVRLTWSYHWTFLVNSACHIWGYQSWNTDDLSKNNWYLFERYEVTVCICRWVAIVTFGEGWYNNHHAFEYSARFGLEWWQLDLGWWFIRVLEAVGLATNVKLPTEAHKLRKSFASNNKLK